MAVPSVLVMLSGVQPELFVALVPTSCCTKHSMRCPIIMMTSQATRACVLHRDLSVSESIGTINQAILRTGRTPVCKTASTHGGTAGMLMETS